MSCTVTWVAQQKSANITCVSHCGYYTVIWQCYIRMHEYSALATVGWRVKFCARRDIHSQDVALGAKKRANRHRC